jgi:hypothetical protein
LICSNERKSKRILVKSSKEVLSMKRRRREEARVPSREEPPLPR